MVNHTCTVKYRCTNTHSAGALWVGVTGEVEETLQQVSQSEGVRNSGSHPLT